MNEPIPVKAVHHVELWVGNAKQAEYYYRKAFGFSRIAYSGPETGRREAASYALAQGKIRLVLTTPLGPDGEMADHLTRHGDGVRDIAFLVEDADAAFAEAVHRGATPAAEPRTVEDDRGRLRRAAIRTWGDTVHSFISGRGYEGPFLPGFTESRIEEPDAGLLRVDHIVGNVEDGKMDEWAGFYERVLGWHQFLSFDDKDISTEFSALRSKVMSSPQGSIKFPINEPAPGKMKSQIQEYLDFYRGAGAQHVALLTTDILASVSRLAANGVEFLEVPDTYYETIQDRIGEIAEDPERIRKLGILVDRDDQGYLLQLFTKPVEDRPTLFFEIIQRAGAQGFGKGNFKALFEAIEREQARRGNL
jgi:4-hydroxyphenylpyruvate dioxygenase